MQAKFDVLAAGSRRLLPRPGSLALTVVAAAGLAVLIAALSM